LLRAVSEEQAAYRTPPEGAPSREARILEAARRVFHRHGMTGARMQEIAEEAEVNQALLHYYFRCKENLFQAVFEADLRSLFALQRVLLEEDLDLFAVIRGFIRNHLDFLDAHPYLPGFVMSEVFAQPERLDAIMGEKRGMGLARAFYAKVARAEADGLIRPTDPTQLMVNIMGLCVHPYVARPLIQRSHQLDDEAYARFVRERREQLPVFIIRAIATDPDGALSPDPQ
jgi:TetR/AcrR family transcriptional regulator